MAELDIEERQIGDVTVLDLRGRLNMGEAGRALRTAMLRVIEEHKKKVVLNLGSVSYIDSSGIQELVSSYVNLARTNGGLRLANLTDRTHDLLVITKLLTVFDVYESVETAVREFDTKEGRISCPVHGCNTLMPFFYPRAEGKCTNCGATINVESTTSPRGVIEFTISSLVFPTYAGENIAVMPGSPTTITVNGRLDLFAAEVLEKAWLTVPPPRRVVFRLEASVDLSPLGIQKLLALCATKADDDAAVILALPRDATTIFPVGSPVYDEEGSALAALGDAPHKAKWTLDVRN